MHEDEDEGHEHEDESAPEPGGGHEGAHEDEASEPVGEEPAVEDAHEDEASGPVDAAVECGPGMALIEAHVTDTDNGCRPEACEAGRGDDGHCLPAEEPLTEEEAAALEDVEPIPYDEYGLEGCTEVSPGVCDKDGVLHCYTVEGWTECPGQPSGDNPCDGESGPDGSITVIGADTITGLDIDLSAGQWEAVSCAHGTAGRINITLTTPDFSKYAVIVGPDAEVASLSEPVRYLFTLTEDDAAAEWMLFAAIDGAVGIEWVVRFIPVGG